MAEYIEREAFIEDIKTEIVNLKMDGLKGTRRPCDELYDFIDRINEQPAADVVEVRHGVWKKIELLGCKPMYECSICEKLHDQDYHYCNNCGAKMDGKGE